MIEWLGAPEPISPAPSWWPAGVPWPPPKPPLWPDSLPWPPDDSLELPEGIDWDVLKPPEWPPEAPWPPEIPTGFEQMLPTAVQTLPELPPPPEPREPEQPALPAPPPPRTTTATKSSSGLMWLGIFAVGAVTVAAFLGSAHGKPKEPEV